MIVNFEILNDLTIDNFAKILAKFKSFREINREIKINSLSDKKMELEIEKINPKIVGYLGYQWPTFDLKSSAFIIEKIIMKMDKGIIINLKCEIKLLETENGKILSDLENSIKFKLVIIGKNVESFYASI